MISSKGNDKVGVHEFKGVIDKESYEHSITLKDGLFVQYLKSHVRSVREREKEIRSVKSN